MTFERSQDYALIREILMDPRSFRRMAGGRPQPQHIEIRELPGIEFVIAREGAAAVAVFLIIHGHEIHFCFVPAVWGHSEPIARAFIEWVWENTPAVRLVGPVPAYNRLALRLALRVGFHIVGRAGHLVLTEIRRP